MSAGATRKMSPGEYLAWERQQGEKHQYLAGEVFATAGGSPRHNRLANRVAARLEAAFADGSWTHRVALAGEQIELTSGAILVVDEIYAGAFELPGD